MNINNITGINNIIINKKIRKDKHLILFFAR